MTDFKKYESILNLERYLDEYDEDYLNKKYYFYITEKIHGCNFQICYDGENFKYGKRTAFLENDEKFNNFQNVILNMEDLLSSIKSLYNFYGKTIIVYGELFGGYYPGFKDKNSIRIQKGVNYHYENKFLFYDIKVGDIYLSVGEIFNLIEDEEPTLDKYYLRPYSVIKCTIPELLKLDNKFNSTIPQMYGLPELESNICEGIVIKTDDELNKFGRRIIFKYKNEIFAEKKQERNKKPKENINDNSDLKDEIKSYINDNRFNAVLSKDSWNKDKIGIFFKEFKEDIINDLPLDLKEKLDKDLIKFISKEISYLYRNKFLDFVK